MGLVYSEPVALEWGVGERGFCAVVYDFPWYRRGIYNSFTREQESNLEERMN